MNIVPELRTDIYRISQ